MQAIVEQYRDDFGIKWPLNVAPYHVVIVPISSKDEAQMNLANELHDIFVSKGIETILDDRDAKPGFKFKDWELIGIPFIITCGRDAQDGNVEFKVRSTLEKSVISKDEAISKVIEAVKAI